MRPMVLMIGFVALAAAAQGQAFLSEIFINPPGTDEGVEALEIQSSEASYSLAGWKLIIIDGDGNAAGGVDQLIDLGPFSTGASGLLLIRDAATALVPEPDPQTNVVVLNFTPDIENGSDTFVLGHGTVGFALNADLDTGNDGTLDDPSLWAAFTVVDAVSFAENDGATNYEYADDLGGTNLGSFAEFNPDALYRALNCEGTAPARWVGGDVLGTAPGPFTFDAARNFGWAEVGVSDPSVQTLTLGSENFRHCPPLPCPGDLDGNEQVDLSDLSALLSQFGSTSCPQCTADIEGDDDDVDLGDLSLLLSNFGAICQ